MMTVQPYTAALAARFDAFVTSARNGTVFHTRQFLSYHPDDRFTDASLLFLEGDRIVAVLPAALKAENGKKMLVSHPGASYGGLVLDTSVSVVDTGAIVQSLIEHAKAEGYAGISLLRLAPSSLQTSFSEDQHYWLHRYGFSVTRVEMDGTVDLSGLAEETILESLAGKCRNMVRQAERAKIEVRLSNDFDAFWPLLTSVLAERHGAKPTHTLAEINALHTLLPKGFRCLTAYREGTVVGGIVLVTVHERALYTLYMAQEYAEQKYHPMHLLLVEAMRLCVREGRDILHLGVSTEDGGAKVNEGLFFFKESFGCKPVRRESFELLF